MMRPWLRSRKSSVSRRDRQLPVEERDLRRRECLPAGAVFPGAVQKMCSTVIVRWSADWGSVIAALCLGHGAFCFLRKGKEDTYEKNHFFDTGEGEGDP